MTTTAQIIDQHRQAARWVGDGVTVECTCGHKSAARYTGLFPMTEEHNNHRDADRKHAEHVANHLARQEPTEEEVLALRMAVHGALSPTAARAALTAAREARS